MAEKPENLATWKFNLENTINGDPLCKGPCLKVMRVYLDWMGDWSSRPYLSIPKLQVYTGLHQDTIIRARRKLEAIGYLVPDGEHGSGATMYRIENPREKTVQDHQTVLLDHIKEAKTEKKRKSRENPKNTKSGDSKNWSPEKQGDSRHWSVGDCRNRSPITQR